MHEYFVPTLQFIKSSPKHIISINNLKILTLGIPKTIL